MYAAAGGGQLIRYPLCGAPGASNPIDQTACLGNPVGSVDSLGHHINFPYGVTPTVSANGQDTDAVVWAMKKPDGGNSQGTTAGVLSAFDAVSMTELYDSEMCIMNSNVVDRIAPASKFSVPTVANSFVYVGSQALDANGQNQGLGTLYIFGALSRTCN